MKRRISRLYESTLPRKAIDTGSTRRANGEAVARVLRGLATMFAAFVTVSGIAFSETVTPSESGFEGAVTVISEEQDGPYLVVNAKLPFLDIYGAPKEGRARLVVKEELVQPGMPSAPAFCYVHYEMAVGSAKHWADRGWATFTAVYSKKEGAYPADASPANGYNQARAIAQWARRLPFIDRTHLHIDGGSQGGYVSLAVSADLFPVTSTTSDCPVANWAYNLNYFEANKPVTKYPSPSEESPLPVVCAVTMLTDWCYPYFGTDLSAEAYYRVSPIAYLDRITNPALVTCATGDMLVPMEQMTREHLPKYDNTAYPEGYSRSFDELTLCAAARKTFEECIPAERREVIILPLQENSFEITPETLKDESKKPEKRPANMDKPWSKDHQWTLLYCDEGPPTPHAGHVSYAWDFSPHGFVAHYQQAPMTPELLNAAKLQWLVQRIERDTRTLPRLVTGSPVNRFNFPDVERRDVLTGLDDFAKMSPAHQARLDALVEETGVRGILAAHGVYRAGEES